MATGGTWYLVMSGPVVLCRLLGYWLVTEPLETVFSILLGLHREDLRRYRATRLGTVLSPVVEAAAVVASLTRRYR